MFGIPNVTHVIGRAKTTVQRAVKVETAAGVVKMAAPVRNQFLEVIAAAVRENPHQNQLQNQLKNQAVRAETVARAVEMTAPVKNPFLVATAVAVPLNHNPPLLIHLV